MRTVYIYVLIDPTTNKVRYLGKTVSPRKRYNAHTNGCNAGNTHTQRWINKLKQKGIKPIMRIIDQCNESNWQDRERHWIESLHKQGVNLTNHTIGGEGMSGYTPRPETVAKRSKILKGSKLSPEARANQSRGRIGMTFSDEHRNNLRKRKLELFDSEHGKMLATRYSREYGVLTDEQVIEVWKLAMDGKIPQWKIAEMYNCPQSTVSEIKANKRYKHVKRPIE